MDCHEGRVAFDITDHLRIPCNLVLAAICCRLSRLRISSSSRLPAVELMLFPADISLVRSVQGLKYRLEVFKTPTCGWAVRTWDLIPIGVFVTMFVGEIWPHQGAHGREHGRSPRGHLLL